VPGERGTGHRVGQPERVTRWKPSVGPVAIDRTILLPRKRIGSLSIVAPPKTALPELDLARIRRYCEGRVPARLRDQIRIELEVVGRSVTIVERRGPWTPEIGPNWTRFPIARLRHVAARGVWELHWRDRNLHWHRYDRMGPSPHVEPLLAVRHDPLPPGPKARGPDP
jgi:hypothetical protein